MPWEIDGAKLRALRDQRCLTLAVLAAKIGMSERQLGRIERGEVPEGQVATVLLLANALQVRDREFARYRATGVDDPMVKKRAPSKPAERLTVRAHADIEMAWAAHEGRRFLIVGRPQTPRPLTELEQYALGARTGAGGHFTIAPSTKGAPRVDVFSRHGEVTLALQSRCTSRRAVRLHTVVQVADRSWDHGTIEREAGRGPDYFIKNWRGFSRNGEDGLYFWAFRVERVES